MNDRGATSHRPWALAATALALLLSAGLAGAQATRGASTRPAGPQGPNATGTWFHAEAINPDLPEPNQPPDLSTPLAALEQYIFNCRRGRWLAAARALNLRLIDSVDGETAAALARKLYYLLNQNLWIDWTLLPDRPDGLDPGDALAGSTSPMAGQPRRSITLGTISHDGRPVPIRVERVKAPGAEPLWLIAAQTVENIGPMYQDMGPSWLARNAPDWSRKRLLWRVPLWQWLALVTLGALGVLVGWLVATVVCRKLGAYLPGSGPRLVEAVQWPAAVLTAGLVSYLAIGSLLTLPGAIAAAGHPIMLTIIVLAGIWLAIRILGFVSERLTPDIDRDAVDESGALARLTVIRYLVVLLIVAVGLSVLLLSLNMFRTLGIALLSSAGAAAVILGIAGHAVLGNLIAGVQIAITRPFRIGDTVIIEGYWGRIEELRYTYVAVRTWDEKRVVFPVKYFLDHYFENWTKTDRYLIKSIYLNVDYRADVQAIRERFKQIVADDPEWASDRDDPDVLVVETGDETMTIRLTCGGADSSSAWRLVCRVREKLIAWLQQHQSGQYLPRRRLVLHDHRQDDQPGGADEDAQPSPTTRGDSETSAHDDDEDGGAGGEE